MARTFSRYSVVAALLTLVPDAPLRAGPAGLPCSNGQARVVVASSSMVPLANKGSVLLMRCINGAKVPITAGDVVVFRTPAFGAGFGFKRVIGIGGDTVQLQRGRIIINGKAISVAPLGAYPLLTTQGSTVQRQISLETLPNGVSYSVIEGDGSLPTDTTNPVVVPAGYVFLLGDFRDQSFDSRAAQTGGPTLGIVALDRIDAILVSVVANASGSRPLTPKV